jgi:hypothetical protein
MQATTKEKVEGSQVGITTRVKPTADHIELALECLNPAAGMDQVIAYIAGDLFGHECQDFIAHVAECRYCLKEVVLWRAAQVLAEADREREKGGSSPWFNPRASSPLPKRDLTLDNKARNGDCSPQRTIYSSDLSVSSPPGSLQESAQDMRKRTT